MKDRFIIKPEDRGKYKTDLQKLMEEYGEPKMRELAEQLRRRSDQWQTKSR